MFFRSLRKSVFVLPLLAILAVTGCRGESGDDAYRNEQTLRLLNQGKALLAQNQWGLAKEVFQQVLDTYDNTNSEARFGLVLADLLSFTDTIRLVSSLTDSFSSAAADEENRFVNQLITDLIHDLRAKFVTIDQNLLLVEANPGFVFRINDLPIYLTNDKDPSTNLAGEWDRADAFLLNALVKGVLGTLDYADSIDLRLDVLRAYDYFSGRLPSDPTLADYESLIAFVLNDPNYPNFLSVKEDGGNELVASAASNLGKAVNNFQIALYMASIESDNQSDDILQYIDRNKNGRYDPPIAREGDKCAHLAEVMAEEGAETRYDTDANAEKFNAPENFSIFGSVLGGDKKLPFLSEQTACLLQKAYHSLAWEDIKDEEAVKEIYSEAPRINLLNDIIPLVDSIVAGIAEDSDVEFLALVNRGLISTTAEEVLGNSIELDLHAFFTPNDTGNAGNLRGLLPVWTDYACGTTGVCANEFVIEMECGPAGTALPVAMTGVFAELDLPICKDEWKTSGSVTDTTHFDAYAALLADFDVKPIPADGFVGYFPYIAFQDGSFHGLLYLNLASLAETFTGAKDEPIQNGLLALDGNDKDFQAASLTDINAFIASLSGYVEGLIND